MKIKEFVEIMIVRLILMLCVEALFAAYDKNKNGVFDLRKYLKVTISLVDNDE